MSSTKHGKLFQLGTGGYMWRCKILKEECGFISLSTRKPRCERCPVAKNTSLIIGKADGDYEDID